MAGGSTAWESEPLRARKRIRRQIDQVFRLCYMHPGVDLVRISKIPGAPGLRTMRRWCAENLYGFGGLYHMLMRERAIDRIQAGVKADLQQIRARAERNRAKNRTESRTG